MQALVSEMEPREEIMSPHHEPEGLLHVHDIDIGLGNFPEEAEPETTEDFVSEVEEPYTPMLMTEENLENHRKQQVRCSFGRSCNTN